MKVALPILFVLAGFGPLALAATLQGTVKDSQGTAVAGATVQIEGHSVQTDARGEYRVQLPEGSYTLKAQMATLGQATFGPFALSEQQIKNIDLVLTPAVASMEFFDEPKFTVAGVTDHTYIGGHGSDTLVRSAEALTTQTASLSNSAPGAKRTEGAAAQHHRLANAYEKNGDPLAAVREYQRAAELEPSEANIFDWGTELLLHRAPEPAVQVFSSGLHLYPRSSRLLLGSAVAYYDQGEYRQSAQCLFEASDLYPDDPTPYLFLGKVQSQEITQNSGFLDRLARFVKVHPDNAWANYYYAIHLSASRRDPRDTEIRAQVQSLLQKAVRLDPSLAAAYLQLGMVYADEQDFQAAIRNYQQAIALDPELPPAHYRLAEAYRLTGDQPKAKLEMDTFNRVQQTSAQKLQRERSELQQFVVALKSPVSIQ